MTSGSDGGGTARDPASPGVRTVLRHASPWTLLVAAAALGTVVLVLWLGRAATFWADEWVFIDARSPWTVDAFLGAHWGHPVMAQVLLWKVLLETVGLRSYPPYLALTAVAHVVVAAGVYRIVRRLAGDPVGAGAALVLLLLGSGGQAILLAMSLNLVGATAAGTWALALFLHPPARGGHVAVALLLLLAVAFSGAGLFFVAAIGGAALLLPGRRRGLVAVAPALVAFLAWRAVWGGGGPGATPIDAAPGQVLAFITTGIGHAAGAVSGLGDLAGPVLVVLLLAGVLWQVRADRTLAAAAVAGGLGLVAVFLVTGLARAAIVEPDGTNLADASRYVYLAAPWLLVLVGVLLARRPPIGLRPARLAIPLVALLLLAVVANARFLPGWGRLVTTRGEEVRAAIDILGRYAGSPAIASDVSAPAPADIWLSSLPPPTRLATLLARYGSPADADPLGPGRAPVSAATLERVLIGYVERQVGIAQGVSIPPGTSAPAVRAVTDATAATDAGCLLVTPTGAAPSLLLDVPGGAALWLASPAGGSIATSLSADGSFSTPATRSISLDAAGTAGLTLPDLEASWPWQVRLELPADGPTRVCLSPATP